MEKDTYREGLQKFQRDVVKFIERFIYRVCIKISDDARRIVQQEKKVATGQLKDNIDYEVQITAQKIMAKIGVNANTPHGIFVHEGTKPHFPPVDAIKKWVIQKGLVRKGSKPTTFRSAKGTNLEKVAQGIAFVIARSIAKRGTKALPFLKIALAQNTGFIQNEINKLNLDGSS